MQEIKAGALNEAPAFFNGIFSAQCALPFLLFYHCRNVWAIRGQVAA